MIELKAGVNPLGMRPEIMLAIAVADEVYNILNVHLVITSISDGKHSANSYHYKGLAVDLRTRYFLDDKDLKDTAKEIKDRLGPLYDVVVEKDHIHLEFDEKRALAQMRKEEFENTPSGRTKADMKAIKRESDSNG